MNWQETGAVAPGTLTSSRLQLHYGAYILGSTAHSVLDHASDDSHSNLGFVAESGSLSTHDLAPGLRLDLDLVPFELALRRGRESVASIALAGQTLESAHAWVGEELRSVGVDASISRREYPDFPESPLFDGAAFEKPSDRELEEHRDWFANALELVEGIRSTESAMSDPRVWPHHFDLGALISEGSDSSIGLGYSPGDGQFDYPYFYCSPYPAPEASVELPSLAAGTWNREGFVSAILPAREIQAGARQGEIARAYLESAVAGCRSVLSAS